jgi:hypothetical protein
MDSDRHALKNRFLLEVEDGALRTANRIAHRGLRIGARIEDWGRRFINREALFKPHFSSLRRQTVSVGHRSDISMAPHNIF